MTVNVQRKGEEGYDGDDHECVFVAGGWEDVNVKLELKWKYIMHKETLLR